MHFRSDDLLIIEQEEEESMYPRNTRSSHKSSQNGLPRSASLPLTNNIQKRAPPPRPPPPKINPRNVSCVLYFSLILDIVNYKVYHRLRALSLLQ